MLLPCQSLLCTHLQTGDVVFSTDMLPRELADIAQVISDDDESDDESADGTPDDMDRISESDIDESDSDDHD